MKRLLLGMALALLAPGLASAGSIEAYNAAEFNNLTAAGKPVVVAVHASWCPVCKAQKPIQSQLMQSETFRAYTLLIVDFDHDPQALARFHVGQQSTMIVFKGKTEVGRSIGDTHADSIKALMLKASA